MNKITNYNCTEMCMQETCSSKDTHYEIIYIHGMNIVVSLCDKHTGFWEKTKEEEKKPEIFEGYDGERIPVLIGEPREDMVDGVKVYCKYCSKYHLHGKGLGHRVAHCINNKSPYNKTGYIIK